MPNLKYPELFHLNSSGAFDVEHAAGATAPHPGLYRCGCGHEVPAAQGAPLPAEGHPLHPEGLPVAWRLVAAARRNEAGAATPPSAFASPAGWPPAGG